MRLQQPFTRVDIYEILSAMAEMGSAFVRPVVIIAHTEQPPPDDEWDAMLATMAEHARELVGVLVLSDGGGPSAVQRTRIQKDLPDLVYRTALLTRSPIARMIGTAIGWLGVDIRTFTPDRYREALEFLRVQPADQAAILQAGAALRTQLAGWPSLSAASKHLKDSNNPVHEILTTRIAEIRVGGRRAAQ